MMKSEIEGNGDIGGGMKPYFETENGKLYHGDFMAIMPQLEPVDLILTDPPYGIGYTGCSLSKRKGLGVIHNGIVGDKNGIDLSTILNAKCDVVVFGANNFPEQLPKRGRWFCWDKRICESADRMKGSSFELAWRNVDSGFDHMFRIMHGGVVNSDGGKRVHPTQKPINLMMRIINEHYPHAKNVLDPFVGSGTTPIACERLCLRWVGIEIDEKYCEIAAKRIESEASQLKLFN